MQRIIFPLEPQMQGPNVARLQAALTLLGLKIDDEEETAQRYGASTRQAVRTFQAQHGLSTNDGWTKPPPTPSTPR